MLRVGVWGWHLLRDKRKGKGEGGKDTAEGVGGGGKEGREGGKELGAGATFLIYLINKIF